MPTSPSRTSTDYNAALRNNTKGRDPKGKDKPLPNTSSRTRSSTKKAPTTTKPTTRGGKQKQTASHNHTEKVMDIDTKNEGIDTATAGLSSNDTIKDKENLSVSMEEDIDFDGVDFDASWNRGG